MRKQKLSLRHEFTVEELDSRRDELAKLTLQEADMKASAKARATEAKEELDIVLARRTHLARQVTAKGEHRETDCLVRFNIPKNGMKQTIRLDTGEVVSELEMDYNERQVHLFEDDPDLRFLAMQFGGDGPIGVASEVPADVKPPAAADSGEIRITEVGPDPATSAGATKADTPAADDNQSSQPGAVSA